jgi:hypothetical protein
MDENMQSELGEAYCDMLFSNEPELMGLLV